MNRDLFGTDGVRGLAGQYPLDQAGATQIGKAVGMHFAQTGQQIVIGSDPRQSSSQLVAAVSAGLQSVGVDVVSAGTIPTPGLAYVTRRHDNFVAGVMITASHNPYQYNGIKVFDANGDKLPDSTEGALNDLIESRIEERGSGTSTNDETLLQSYEDFLVASAEDLQLNGLAVGIDSANGAASGLAQRLFGRLGASVTSRGAAPDGRNINDGCGATDTAALQKLVVDNNLDLGAAVDGDADRIMLIDKRGRQLNGDHILYILAVNGGLKGVVATVMSNLGLEQSLNALGIDLQREAVGDRYVLAGLARTGYKIGGEQSGHIIIPELLKTGDALLVAVQVLQAITTSNKSLAQWYDEVPMLPQALVNIPLADKSALQAPAVQAYINEVKAQFSGNGRLLIRPSGTEPLVRVMVEAADADAAAQQIADKLKALLV